MGGGGAAALPFFAAASLHFLPRENSSVCAEDGNAMHAATASAYGAVVTGVRLLLWWKAAERGSVSSLAFALL
jgi:hypothetical protein